MAVSVKELVAEGLASSTAVVRSRVIEALVLEEQDKRVKAVLKVIQNLDQTRKDGFKLKPDVMTYDRDGKVASEGYTKTTTDAIKANQELISKLEGALNEALDESSPNFEKVLKLGSGGDKKAEQGDKKTEQPKVAV